jgi:predicted nucleic acid-binding protein
LSRLVLDASVTLCWFFEDQATPFTEAILDRLNDGSEAVVAAIWPVEIVNTMAVAERRKLVKAAQIAAFIEQLRQLAIIVDPLPPQHVFGAVFETARRYGLSAYDAEYLELAAREALPLATIDRQLRDAATAAGVRLA